jgi:hypothetical protein
MTAIQNLGDANRRGLENIGLEVYPFDAENFYIFFYCTSRQIILESLKQGRCDG